MGYAGYGNHSEPPQPPDTPQELIPQESPRGGAAPATSTREPGGEAEHAKFARIKPGVTPPWHETSPHRRDGNPTVSPEATREISTPAEGAGPLPTEGDDVDPGLG